MGAVSHDLRHEGTAVPLCTMLRREWRVVVTGALLCVSVLAVALLVADEMAMVAATTAFGWFLVAITISDLRTLEIPLRIPLVGFAAALVWAGYTKGVGAAMVSGINGTLCAIGLWGLSWTVGRARKKEVMGFADVVVVLFLGAVLGLGSAVSAIGHAALGALVGFAVRRFPEWARVWALIGYLALVIGGVALGGVVLVLSYAVLIYSVVRPGDQEFWDSPMPFAPWLCFGAVLAIAFPDPISVGIDSVLPWYGLGAPGSLLQIGYGS